MTQDTVNQDVKTDSAGNSVNNSAVTQDDKQNQVPQARVNEIVSKSRAEIDKLTEENNQFKAEKEQARKKQLEADGKQSELIAEQEAELKVLREDKAKRENERKERHEKLIEALPENQRAIYSGLSLEALEEHIKLSTPESDKLNTDTRQPLRNGKGISNEDWTKMDEKERRSVWGSVIQSYKKS